MKRFMVYSIMVLCLFEASSCEKEPEEPNVKTVKVEQGGVLNARMYINTSGVNNTEGEFGAEISTDASFSYDKTKRVTYSNFVASDGEHVLDFDDLIPGQKYYCRAICTANYKNYYGELLSFSIQWEAPEIKTLKAEFFIDGFVKLYGELCGYSELCKEWRSERYLMTTYSPVKKIAYHGFEFSSSSDFGEDTQIYINQFPDERTDTMTYNIFEFEYDKKYYYRFFYKLDFDGYSNIKYGEIKSFCFDGAVDLGLSVKWAACNLGANTPELRGDYFAWGETETKSEFEWSNYKYAGKYVNIDDYTKYCLSQQQYQESPPDNKSVLDLEDDAAHVKKGGNWRIPTPEEIQELLNNCTWTKTYYPYGKSFRVYKVVSNQNGNYIYIPTDRLTSDNNQCFNGYLWSNTLSKTNHAISLYVSYESRDKIKIEDKYSVNRYRGYAIRPVCP